MKEKTILKVSIIIILVGLIFLFLYAGNIDLKAMSNLDEALPEDEIKLKGTITRLSISDKVAFIELEGSQVVKTDVVLFNDQDVYLQEGDYVEISGTVEEYNNEKEIIANKIVKK
jgi:DNA/RNA endonuclease YhcR with UshA esterase domain